MYRTLVIAPYYDRNVAGEAWCTYMWVKGICDRTKATVLTTHRAGWSSERSPVNAAQLVKWTHPHLRGRFARMDVELKPHYLLFHLRVKRWLKDNAEDLKEYDLVHQINPVGLRYPSPAVHAGLPFITGPHAGSLSTPPGFESELKADSWFRKLRAVDAFRMRHDPWLRRTFQSADLVLGVAPYVESFLRHNGVRPQRFEVMAETGPESLQHEVKAHNPDRPLRLLFVGRVIRTKGTIDAIRAMGSIRDRCAATLDVAGEGDMLEHCKREAAALGVSDRVRFHGRISRTEVYGLYGNADVFLFPSFREPSGTVVFEALGCALPIITSTVGGPGYVVTTRCGVLVEPTTPAEYAVKLGEAILRLDRDRELLRTMSGEAFNRVQEVASWETRYGRLLRLYGEVGK